ncbi:MAG: electron transport complex subunit E [Tissierellia bacterium]|nr:electron transport complex subunit E [Tissierellia bacterium]
MKIKNMFMDGIFKNNPVLVQTVGLCSVLAVSSSVEGAVGMSAAVIFVLLASNIVVSLLRKIIPDEVRIPAFIVIIATFVTIIEMVMKAYMVSIYDTLGIFLPLIVVNCIILARAESFASKNNIGLSAIDGIANGLGYSFVIIVLAIIREMFGKGTVWGFRILPEDFTIGIFNQAPSAFILLGLLVATVNWVQSRKNSKEVE